MFLCPHSWSFFTLSHPFTHTTLSNLWTRARFHTHMNLNTPSHTHTFACARTYLHTLILSNVNEHQCIFTHPYFHIHMKFKTPSTHLHAHELERTFTHLCELKQVLTHTSHTEFKCTFTHEQTHFSNCDMHNLHTNFHTHALSRMLSHTPRTSSAKFWWWHPTMKCTLAQTHAHAVENAQIKQRVTVYFTGIKIKIWTSCYKTSTQALDYLSVITEVSVTSTGKTTF